MGDKLYVCFTTSFTYVPNRVEINQECYQGFANSEDHMKDRVYLKWHAEHDIEYDYFQMTACEVDADLMMNALRSV